MVTEKQFIKLFESNSRDEEKLKELIKKSNSDAICEVIVKNASQDLGLKVWTSVLSQLDDEDKLLKIVEDVLPKLNRDHLATKVLSDFYTRLCIEIPRFSLKFIVRLSYFCDTSIQFGDPRACFFKDVLPCLLQVLAKSDQFIPIDGTNSSASEHHQQIINAVLTKPFKVSVLSSITTMFKDIPLNKQQMEMLMGKICDNLPNVQQSDVPRLALASFNLSLFKKIVIPILALDSYFYNKRYMKKFVEFDSASDIHSIDATADKGIIETEENVICHFQHVTEFTSIEKDIVASLKPLAFAPKFIISPFIITVLVSFAKMSSSTVAGNLRLPQSILLPLIKQVFKNNEKHREIRRRSAWARSVEKFEPIDIEKLLKVLQENTCKLGQSVALNGFIGLAFMLLKTANAPELNDFAIQFLSELVRQRQEFTSDIMKIVVKMLFSEKNKTPIIECFSTLVQRRTLLLERCHEAFVELIENFTELELETALAIESVIHNTIIRSSKLRDLMTKTMRSAMYQNRPEMRKLAVYSFCAMLKKVKQPRYGSSNEVFGASQNISMMSLLSQTQLPSIGDVHMRRVSVLVLEILGILRKCFSHTVEIRETLYESLLNAVAANEFIIPNVLELVEPHFRGYFDCEDPETLIDFSKALKQLEQGEVVVMDHIGKFLHFFIGCLQIVKEKELMEENNLQLANLRRILEKLLDEICYVSMEKLGVFSMIDAETSVTINQFLNCLQALILHCSYDLTNENVANITRLFEKHQTVIKEAKRIQESSKKSIKRGKNQTEVSVAPGKKIELVFDCLWDLKACGNFLKIFFDSNFSENIDEIKQNSNLCRFVLKSTAENILHLSTAPDYLKFKHSKSSFTALGDFTAIVYKQIKLDSFEKLYNEFDEECAVALSEAFNNSILTMDLIYNSTQKWQEFLQKVTGKGNKIDAMINDVIRSLQSIIDWVFDEENKKMNDESGVKVVANLFTAIETIFRNFQSLPNAYAREAYTWLLQFCQTHTILNKNLQMVNRILFQFMVQQDAGCTIAESTAHKIASTYKLLDESLQAPADATQNELLSINSVTIDQTFFSFTAVVKKQIEDVEFCISRMNSFNAILKIPGQPSHNENAVAMKVLEMSTVIKLASLGRIIGRLCNARFSAQGTHIETIGRVVTNYFICLGNLMKHFNQHFEVKKLDFQYIPLEMLLKEVKGTALKAYALSPYIEELYEQEQKKAAKANAGKKKKVVIVKELKYSSRLVGAAEKLTTIVQKFDKLANRNFSKYMYSGEVRDFRISERNTSHRESGEDENMEQVSDEAVESESTRSDLSLDVTKKRQKRLVLSSDDTNSDSENSPILPQSLRANGFAKNLKKIVKRTKSKAATAKTRKRK